MNRTTDDRGPARLGERMRLPLPAEGDRDEQRQSLQPSCPAEEAGYVEIEKTYRGKVPMTLLRLSGRAHRV